MAKSPKSSLVYARFLNLVTALDQAPGFPDIDPIEERLINRLAAEWFADRKVSVLEAMRAFPDASATTVHRRLKSLRKKGIIELESDVQDTRTKYVEPTSLTMNRFAKLGKCIQTASKVQ